MMPWWFVVWRVAHGASDAWIGVVTNKRRRLRAMLRARNATRAAAGAIHVCCVSDSRKEKKPNFRKFVLLQHRDFIVSPLYGVRMATRPKLKEHKVVRDVPSSSFFTMK